MNSRKNGWTIEQEQLLLDTILVNTRKGEELNMSISIVSNKVNRSYAAVYGRWNSKIKKENQELYDDAVLQGVAASNGELKVNELDEDDELTMGEIMHYTMLIEEKVRVLVEEKKALQKENHQLRSENQNLRLIHMLDVPKIPASTLTETDKLPLKAVVPNV
jgi:RsfA family transcription factor